MTRDKFVSAVLQNALTVQGYKIGCDGRGKDHLCDCIGLIRGAFSILGVKFDTPGVNYSARHDISGLVPFQSTVELKLGDVVLKTRKPGQDGYSLPERYKNDPDQLDYYHIGVVTCTNPFTITHCTTVPGGIQKDTGKRNWSYKGRMKQVEEEKGGDVTVVKAIVTAKQGSTVNLRGEPNKRSAVLIQVPINKEVDILKEEGAWCQVKYQEIKGYMMTEFLIPVGEIEEPEGPIETEPVPPSEIPIGYVTVKLPETAALALWEALDAVVGKG